MIMRKSEQVIVGFSEDDILIRTELEEVAGKTRGRMGFACKHPKSEDYVHPSIKESTSVLEFYDIDELDNLVEQLNKLKLSMIGSNKALTLKDLKIGMIVETRCGYKYLVQDGGIMLSISSWDSTARYKEDLTHNDSHHLDITRIYEPKKPVLPENFNLLKDSDIIWIKEEDNK